jgi:hypothetical protein
MEKEVEKEEELTIEPNYGLAHPNNGINPLLEDPTSNALA